MSLRVDILACGRLRDPPVSELVDRYLARLPWQVRLLEIETGGGGHGERKLAAQAARIRAAAAGAFTIVLDERGEAPASVAFARRLAELVQRGHSRMVFVIGGPDGLPPEVREAADWLLSFGPMTWPHGLVRVMLAEQLYRAASLLAGHPYHRP